MKVCDLETSKSLQALGYDGEYNDYYLPDGTPESICHKVMTGQPLYAGDDFIPAPRLDDAAYWLRDNRGIFPIAVPFQYSDKFRYRIYVNGKDGWEYEYFGDPYPDCDTAIKAAVEDAIKIVKGRRL